MCGMNKNNNDCAKYKKKRKKKKEEVISSVVFISFNWDRKAVRWWNPTTYLV